MAFLTPERSLPRGQGGALHLVDRGAFRQSEDPRALSEPGLSRQRGVRVDAAARRYFAKPASDLTLAEAAMLAGLIRAPSRYAPTRDLGLARARAAVVLNSMVETGSIRAADAAAAKAAPAQVAAPRTRAGTGYFADWVFAESRLHADADQPRPWCAPRSIRSCNAPRRRRWRRRSPRRARPRGRAGGAGRHDPRRPGPRHARRRAYAAVSSIARPRRSASPARRSSCSSTSPGWRPGCARRTVSRRRRSGQRLGATQSGRPLSDQHQPARLRGIGQHRAVRLGEEVGRHRVIRLAERLGITSPLHDEVFALQRRCG